MAAKGEKVEVVLDAAETGDGAVYVCPIEPFLGHIVDASPAKKKRRRQMAPRTSIQRPDYPPGRLTTRPHPALQSRFTPDSPSRCPGLQSQRMGRMVARRGLLLIPPSRKHLWAPVRWKASEEEHAGY